MGFLHLWASIIAAALKGCERTTSFVPTIALMQLCMRFRNRFNDCGLKRLKQFEHFTAIVAI